MPNTTFDNNSIIHYAAYASINDVFAHIFRSHNTSYKTEVKIMLIHGKQFSELEETDLRSLIEDQVAEGKYVEYKRSLPSNSDRDKREFLADVSSSGRSGVGPS